MTMNNYSETMAMPSSPGGGASTTAAGGLPSASAATIGMQLDAALAQLDSLSSTQLYVLIVFVTVLISSILLGNAQPTDDILVETTSNSNSNNDESHHHSPKKNKRRKSSLDAAPEPRWYLFRIFNYAMMAAFAASVVAFSLQFAATTTNDTTSSSTSMGPSTMLRFLVGWSVFLIYFFGFFGVSFVNDVEQDNASTASSTTEDAAESRDPSVIQKKAAPHGKAAPVSSCHTNDTCTSSLSAKRAAPSTKANLKNVQDLSDQEIANLVLTNQMKDHELEKRLKDTHRAVVVRRAVMEAKLAAVLPSGSTGTLANLPHSPSLDYSRVYGANCEIVVGYVPIPVGLVGPLTVNGQDLYVPMATTEGCLVASTNRGAKAITAGGFGGATAVIFRDGITRAPCVRMESAQQAARLKMWCEEGQNFLSLKKAFESTTSFGKLKSCVPTVAGKNVYLRLTCFSGDAMGMNMVSKGSLAVIELLQKEFPSLHLVALSGNMCTDKKAAATNWLEGRGKSVVVEAIIAKDVVRQTLKTTVQAIVETNLHKNLIGSAMAGTIGGFNAHAANIVTAVFLATGQDPAQNVESSNCITLLEETAEGDLWISCTMPSLEVGTVGGGTSLAAQAACLSAIGCKGGSTEEPGKNAQKLAQVVAAATMAGELSLLSALAANTLVQAHMQHNRKK